MKCPTHCQYGIRAGRCSIPGKKYYDYGKVGRSFLREENLNSLPKVLGYADNLFILSCRPSLSLRIPGSLNEILLENTEI